MKGHIKPCRTQIFVPIDTLGTAWRSFNKHNFLFIFS